MVINKPFRIVILGAGYAGMFLAINLYQSLKEMSKGDSDIKGKNSLADVEIILIDRNSYHQLLQEIHLVAAGYRTAEQISIPVTSLIYRTEIRFIQSNVKEIRAGEHKVILDGSIIDYDLVVICLGSTTKYFGIKGAMTNTFPFRSIDDATLIHSKIQSFSLSQRSYIRDKMKKNDDDKKGSNGGDNNITIVGGGATGVSLGGAIADFLKDQAKLKERPDSPPPFKINSNVTIVEASSNILTGWDPELASNARTILESKGVRILTNSEVSKIEHDNLILRDGSTITSSLIIWTAGVKGYEIEVTPQTDKTKDGRIIVNGFCQIDNYPNIFVIGDIAAVKDNHGKIYPPIAQLAVREAKYLADILTNCFDKLSHDNTNIKNFITLKDQDVFDYDIKVQIISLGADDYVGIFGKHVISGNLAKMIDEFGKLTYMRFIKTGGQDISSNLYEDSMLSKMIA
ncbi:MAG TPA: FAD-dependent oxidoreductase, partial [Nitrososphaeraceae archaeon]|nr:FAD-dependent oxidoreductase [Nitrososphaeraceae archaeon]